MPRTLSALASLVAVMWTLTLLALLLVSSASAAPRPPSTVLSLVAGEEGWSDSAGPDPEGDKQRVPKTPEGEKERPGDQKKDKDDKDDDGDDSPYDFSNSEIDDNDETQAPPSGRRHKTQ